LGSYPINAYPNNNSQAYYIAYDDIFVVFFAVAAYIKKVVHGQAANYNPKKPVNFITG
jgi:hypothetical protein